MTEAARHALIAMGQPPGDLHALPTSTRRFADGGQFRIEIPSTEGARCLEAVLEEAAALDVPIHRVSQGSGVLMLTDAELDEMVALAAGARVELSLFTRPTAGWTTSAGSLAESGAAFASAIRGADQLVAALADIERAAAHGVRSVLVSDLGLLTVMARMRDEGALPGDMAAKTSVMLPVANPAMARLVEDLGADSINVPVDLELAQLAAIRAAVDVPLDVYIEAPPDLGGFVRLAEIAEIVRVAAPIYVKFGLRNGPPIYPAGAHLGDAVVAMGRERVRRARLGLEMLERTASELTMSPVGVRDLRVPLAPLRAGATSL